MKEKLTEKLTAIFTGEKTVTKKELFLMLAACTLSGIVIGLLTAPFTHGIRVSCGNNNGNNNGNRLADDQKEEQDHLEECECVGVCDCK